MFVGRDTRGSGPELEEAFGRGVASAGGNAILAGVLPTPAVALLALDLGAVISASHNPPQYNGVKLFDGEGRKLTDAAEEEIEASTKASSAKLGEIDHVGVATDSHLEHIVERFGSDLSGLRIARRLRKRGVLRDCAQGFERLGAEVTPIAAAPDGENINVGCGATDLSLLERTVVEGDSTSASRSTVMGIACLLWTRRARRWTATRSSRFSPSTLASIESPSR